MGDEIDGRFPATVGQDVTNGDGVYSTAEFTEFDSATWTGSKWDLLDNGAAGHGPWTEITCSGGHPAANGQTDDSVHWAIRRWVSDITGPVTVECYARNNSGGGDGTVARVLHNGTELASAFTDGFSTRFSVDVDLAEGDILDFAIDPDGAGNLDPQDPATLDNVNDGSDGTEFVITIVRGLCPTGFTACVCGGASACEECVEGSAATYSINS